MHCLLMAAGTGGRFGGGLPKQFTELAGKPLISWSLEKMAAREGLGRIVTLVPPGYESMAEELISSSGLSARATVVAGGVTRDESVRRGLDALGEKAARVIIHDAARPCFSGALLARVMEELERSSAVVPVLPAVDTLYKEAGGYLDAVLDRFGIVRAQTPQGFDAGMLADAHRRAAAEGVEASDDGTIALYAGVAVKLVAGEARNIKVTFAEDIVIAEAILKEQEAAGG